MLPILSLLAGLVLALAWRGRFEANAPSSGRLSSPAPAEKIAGFGLVLLALGCFAPLARRVVRADALVPPDAAAHIWTAQQIARGLPHGWVDVSSGGFPFGLHYQSVAVLVLAAAIRLGVPPTVAANALGLVAGIAPAALLYAVLRAARVRPAAAAAGGLALLWAVSCYTFVGLWDAYLAQGFLSQVVGVDAALLALLCAVQPRLRPLAPLAAVIAVAAHTQIAVASLLVAVAIVAAIGSRGALRVALPSLVAAAAAGLAIYGPGARLLALPIAWSSSGVHDNRTFPFDDAPSWWFEGSLLDCGRFPFTTCLVSFAVGACLGAVRDPRARGALAAFAVVVMGAQAGPVLRDGPLAHLLDFVAPQRVAVLIAVAAGAVIGVGLDAVVGAARKTRLGARSEAVAWGVAGLVGVAGWVSRASWLGDRAALETELADCGPTTPPGWNEGEIRRWVHGLHGGRLHIDVPSFEVRGLPLACPTLHGVEEDSAVPVGFAPGGPGTQVGVLTDAYQHFDATGPHASERSESLGVRSILHTKARRPTGAFRVVASDGDVELSERVGGTDFIGVGCVERRWTGSYGALRDRLFEEVAADASLLTRPRALVEVVDGRGPVVEAPVDLAGCDASGAHVTESTREPGVYEASVDAPAPVDVVVRATWFPTWEIRVDGVPMTFGRVAPGWMSVRVGPGVHHVVASYAQPRGYAAGVVGSILLAIALGFAGGIRRRAAAP